MDIDRMIRELRAERDRVDEILVALERLKGDNETSAVKRRGRKFMDKSGRKEVSERMKRYWATRRKDATVGAKGKPNGAPRDQKSLENGVAPKETPRKSEANSGAGAHSAAA